MSQQELNSNCKVGNDYLYKSLTGNHATRTVSENPILVAHHNELTRRQQKPVTLKGPMLQDTLRVVRPYRDDSLHGMSITKALNRIVAPRVEGLQERLEHRVRQAHGFCRNAISRIHRNR